jgi:hypothetical protein
MAQQTYVLIDAAESVVREGKIAEGSAGGRKWNVTLRTLHGGRSEGVQVVEIDNGVLCIDVLPTRGMGIWRVRRGDKKLGWQAPAPGPVHPAFVPLMEPAGLGWLEGFNELLCRCGLESNGPPEFDEAGRLVRPLHGRVANTPAKCVELIVDEDAHILSLRGVIEESRFHFQSLRLTTTLTTTIGSDEFSWSDTIENIGGRDATLQMLYHFNLGQPLLQPGAYISAPLIAAAPLTNVAADAGIETWDTMPPPSAASVEQVYCVELAADDAGNTRTLVQNLTHGEAVSLQFNKRALPCLTIWRNTAAEDDGYVLGIEPGTNFPNPLTFEKKHRRVVTLKPGESWQAKVTAAWHLDGASISEQQNAIHSIQGKIKATLFAMPRKEWSAGA